MQGILTERVFSNADKLVLLSKMASTPVEVAETINMLLEVSRQKYPDFNIKDDADPGWRLHSVEYRETEDEVFFHAQNIRTKEVC